VRRKVQREGPDNGLEALILKNAHQFTNHYLALAKVCYVQETATLKRSENLAQPDERNPKRSKGVG